MTGKTWIIFGAVIVVLFGGLIAISAKDRIDVSNLNQNSVLTASEQSGSIADQVYGNKDSKVILVEYGDFQCPGCASAYQPVKTVMEKYKDQVAFVFRNNPLTSIHPNAKAAAANVEAAGLMGKYWEMHDVVYQNQDAWKGATATERNDLFASYATQVGLDGEKFKKTLADNTERINKKINFDLALGGKSKVTGTPTFYLNGDIVDQKVKDGKLVGANEDGNNVWGDADALDTLIIQPALKKAGIALPKE